MTGCKRLAARAAQLACVLLLAGAGGCRCGARAPGEAAGEAGGQADPGAPVTVAAGETGAPSTGPTPASTISQSAGERIVLGEVAVHTVDPEVPREIYPRQQAQHLSRLLTASGVFAARATDVPAGLRARPASLELRIRYDVLDQGSSGGPTVVAAVESRVIWSTASRELAPANNVFAERPLREGEQLDELLAVHVAATVEQVGRGLVIKERLRTGDDEALAAVLGDAEATVDMEIWALELAGQRRSLGLFEAVAGHLAAEDPMVRDRAVEVLVMLGDERAVDRLTREARFDDHVFLRTVIGAVVALGGDDARAYLEFLASGHPEQDIRARAAEGLERLRSSR